MCKSKITLIHNIIIFSFILILPLLLLSCTKEKREAPISTTSFNPSGPATLSTLQTDVFLLGCAVSGCHDNRANPAAGLSMVSDVVTFGEIVNKPSQQLPSMMMVAPGDIDNSYFLHKIQGSHLTVGGNGQQMPQFAASLPQGQIDRVVQWILDGAQKN